jgi:hypothetical protein
MGAEGQAAIEAGGLIVDILYSGDLLAWIQANDLHVSVVKPKPGDPSLTELQSREWSYIVDLKTMQIVWTGFGSYAGLAPDSMKTAIDQLHTFLGQ